MFWKSSDRKILGIVLVITLIILSLGALPAPGVGEKEFLIKNFSPNGEVNGRIEIKAVFNRDAAPENKIGKSLSPEEIPFIFTPAISGTGKWVNNSTFVYYPKAGLLDSATSYTAVAKAGLRDREGLLLSGKQSFLFNTAPPRYIGARQIDFDLERGTVSYELEFSLPVSPARLRGYIDVKEASGNAVEFQILRGPVSKKIRLKVITQKNIKNIKLTISAGMPAESGNMGLLKDISARLDIIPKMEIRDSNAISRINNGEIYIETTSPVDFSKAGGFVELSPKSSYTMEPRDRGFAIVGPFDPQDRVKLTIRKGFPALSGKPLEAEWQRTFIFPEKLPEISFTAPGRILSPSGSMRIPIETVNIDTVQILVWKLFENNIPIGMRNPWSRYPIDLSSMLANKEYKVQGGLNRKVRSALDLKPLIGNEKGVFLLVAQNNNGKWAESRQVVNVTDIGVTVKAGPDSALLWINSVSTGEPVRGAKVTLWSWSNQPVATGTTDRKGILQLKFSSDLEMSPVLATVSKGSDTAFIRFDKGLYEGKDIFDTNGDPWIYKGYSAYCYTPRDIFRPGENIFMASVVRAAGNISYKPFPVNIKIFNSKGALSFSATEKLTNEGTLSKEFHIPADAPTGTWHMSINVPGEDKPIGRKEFYVEEFAAPRLFVDAEASPDILVGKESAELSISSRYVFGSPASGLPWESEMRTAERDFSHANWKGFVFRDSEKKFQPESEYLGSGKLDQDGRTKITLPSRERTAPSALDILAGASVFEEGGRRVTKTAVLRWYPFKVLVGISLAERVFSPGKPVNFSVAAVKPDGTPSSAKEIKYSIFRVAEQRVTYEKYGRTNTSLQQELLPREEGTARLSSGKGSGSFVPSEAGKYLLRAEEMSCGSRASQWIYVYGREDADGSDMGADTVEIITDRERYKPGEKAVLKIRSPHSGKLLIGVETFRVLHSSVYDIKKGETEVSFKVTDEMVPNAWITAQVITEGNKTERSRAYGVAPLYLDNSDQKLNVTIENAEKIKPGTNEFRLKVADSRGRAKEADVTVMLVDEAILELTDFMTPDPWKHFTSKRMLGVKTYDIYDSIIRPEDPSSPLLTPGGDGPSEMALKNSNLSQVQAKRFKMLSLVKRVRSNSKGECVFSFNVPEFAGKARLMAVAVTPSEFGAASAEVNINRDIVIEPSFPRFMAPGDRITIPCQVFNRSSGSVKVSLDIEADGPLKINGTKNFSLMLKQNSEHTFKVSFEATGIGTANASFAAKWNGEIIKTKLEVPVRPASPKISESFSEVIEPGKAKDIKIPGSWMKGTMSGTLILSAMPSADLQDIARFLITYPHGCMEQTVSSAWPLLLQRELAASFESLPPDYDPVKNSLGVRIQKILGLQNYDGGFIRWQGESWSQPWDSIYGTHFLLEAQKNGIKVPQERITEALKYVKRQLSVEPYDINDERVWRQALSRRAYACYVLALSGETPLGWMESLRDKADSLDASGRLFLAASYAVLGQKGAAEKMLGRKTGAVREDSAGRENYDSNLRNNALDLLVRTHIDPRSAGSASSAASLLASVRKTSSLNTQEGAFAMLALSKFFKAQPIAGEPSGKLLSGQKTLGTVTSENRTISVSLDGKTSFSAVNTGSSRLFVSWSAEGIPLGKVKNRDNGIELRLSMTDRKGKPAGAKILRGTALISTITVKPNAKDLRNVAVVVPLPAGLEIENPRFSPNGEALPPFVRAEARDDRLILYIEKLEKKLEWKFILRAVTAGTFDVPQISAECMYEPAVSSVSGGGRIEIR
ncbi:MAG: MG2 domain-containing protein [Synergistaceae bacterium]|nr:MG2 domain-containing protein [Synergistaceae bacterium]